MKPLPKTHFDFFRDHRPKLIEAAIRRAERIIGEERDDLWPLSTKEQVDLGAADDVRAELARLVDEQWRMRPQQVRRLGLTKEEFTELLSENGTMDQAMTAVAMDYANILNFLIFGKRTFFFSEGLAERLAETELNVDASLVRPPFRCCVFVFDDTVTRNALNALVQSRDGSADGAPASAVVSVYVTLLRHAEGFNLILYAISADRKDIHIVAKRELLLRDGERVEDALHTEWKSDRPGRRGNDALFYGPGLKFVRIVVNAILYIASAAPEISGPLRAEDLLPPLPPSSTSKQRRNRLDRIARSSGLTYIAVGGSLHSQVQTPTGPSDTTRTLSTRFMVRGHWRWQPHGIGRRERKLIYVEPFWKGPDMAEMVDRPYIVR